MSLIKDALKGFALAHALPVVGLLFALAVSAYGGLKIYGAHQRAVAFDKGAAFARDSAREASILREIALKDSVATASHQAAVDSSRKADSARSQIANIERHSPRIEALPHPVDTADLVGVTVESTGEHFILPRAAARYWFVSDSLVGVASSLLAKYSAANKQWADAWQKEHDARAASDSLVALLQSRTVPVAHPPSRTRRVVSALAFVAVGFIAAKRVH